MKIGGIQMSKFIDEAPSEISLKKEDLSKTFEQELQDVEIKIVEIARMYVKDQADNVFVHILCNGNTISIDYFYRFGKKLLKKEAINEADSVSMDTFDVTQENQQKTLESMTREFAKAMASAKKHEKPIPSEIRLTYDKKSNRLLPQMRQDSLDAMYFARSHANWFYDIEEKVNLL